MAGYLTGSSRRRLSNFAALFICFSPTTDKVDQNSTVLFVVNGCVSPAQISRRAMLSSAGLKTGKRQQSIDNKMMPADHISMAVVW
jgi:hypothetical protein